MFLVYKIVNKIDGKIYVGITTKTLLRRFVVHKYEARKGQTLYKPLFAAMSKYGFENFEITLIEECSSLEEMKNREVYWIKELDCKAPKGYNITDGGEAASGAKRPDMIARNKQRCTGIALTAEHKKRVGDSHRGMIRPIGTGAKIAATKLGKKRGPVSQETKLKLSNAAKLQWQRNS